MYFPENMTAQYFFFDTYPGQFLQVLPVALVAGLLAVTVVPMGVWGSLWYRLLYGMPSGTQVELFTFSYRFALDLTHFDGEKAMNLLLFAPFALLHPLSCRRPRWRRTAGAGALAVLAVELVQPVFGRAFDVNDIVLNLAGILLVSAPVFGLLRAVRGRRPKESG